MTPSIRILLVEDMPTDAELAQRQIARAVGACEFRRVDTREDFLAALASFAPDLIVSDYRMPRFDGLTALKLALAHAPATPVIILTSAINEDTAVECMKAGAADYVIKEHKKRLGQAVTHALAEKQVRVERAAAEATLAMFRMSIERSSDSVFWLNRDGSFSYVNEQACRALGYTREELLALRLPDIDPVFRMEQYAEFWAKLERTEVPSTNRMESIHRRRDGSVYPVEVLREQIAVGDRMLHVAYVRDISERKLVEEQLRASEAGLRDAQELARLGNWELNLASGELHWSDEIYRIFEIDPDRSGPSHQALLSATHPEDRAIVNRVSLESLANGTSYVLVHRLAMPDGRIKVVEQRSRMILGADGTPVRAAGTVQDITPLHAAEQALRASEERFRALIEQGMDLVMTISADGRLQFASPSLAGTLGYEPAEVLGMHFSELLHPDDTPQVGPLIAAVLDGRLPTARATFRARVKAGGWRVLEGAGRNLMHVPAVRGMVMNLRDVTEQRALEERLLQTEKLDSIGRLAGGIAHDFNNVLTAILGYAEVMQQDATDGQPMLTEDLREIQAAAERARGLTSQLLTFARKQTIAPRPTDLNEVVRGTRTMLGPMLGEDIEIRVALDSALWRVHVDPSQIGQVVMNLAVNARDAMPTGGRIAFETRNVTVPGDADAEGLDLPTGRYAMMLVSDSGLGIADSDLPHIFEPFYTTKPEGKGTGLGLATVYGIVKQSAGHIRVSSEPGAGTTFRFFIPCAVTGAEPEVDDSSPAIQSLAGTETLLVVEDDDAVRTLTVRALRDAGYVVLEAASPDEAIRVSRQTPGVIHLLVTDVIMPGKNGVQLARELLVERRDMRVLYVSGYTQDAIDLHGGERAALDLLDKPFTLSALRGRVRNALNSMASPTQR